MPNRPASFRALATPEDLAGDAAAGLVAHMPRDQALGLRLIALARAAAAAHMAEAVYPYADAPPIGTTQAARLAARLHGPANRGTRP